MPSHAKPSALRTARFDEGHVFDRWLSDEQIAGLLVPLDLQARACTIGTSPMTPAQAARITVTVDAADVIAEITKDNHEVTVRRR